MNEWFKLKLTRHARRQLRRHVRPEDRAPLIKIIQDQLDGAAETFEAAISAKKNDDWTPMFNRICDLKEQRDV